MNDLHTFCKTPSDATKRVPPRGKHSESVRSALALTAILTLLLGGCGGSDDSDSANTRPDPIVPPSTPDHRYFAFSGYVWEARKTTQPQGAGLNYYSSDERDVWVDADKKLHMKISRRDGKWLCSEIFSTGQFGYGTYVFRIAGQPDQLDRNAVLGLFTWDDNCFQTGALSELDIEITRWGGYLKNLHYAVQPTHGPDVVDGYYPERSSSWFMGLTQPESTHVFTWARGYVNFASYQGFDINDDNQIANWEFLSTNPARRYDLATFSTPVTIPAPSPTTTARISLWLYDDDKDGLGDPPANGTDVEVVIESFDFVPIE